MDKNKLNRIKFGIIDFSIKWGWLFIGLIGLLGIAYHCIYIEVDNDSYESAILPLSCGMLSSTFIYLVVSFLPLHEMRKMDQRQLVFQFKKLQSLVQQSKESIYTPFSMKPVSSKTREEYIQDFEKFDLDTDYWFDSNITILYYLENKRNEISLIAESLSTNSSLSLSQKEILVRICESYYVNTKIRPVNKDLQQEGYDYPNNQKEIGESLYDLHELANRLVAPAK